MGNVFSQNHAVVQKMVEAILVTERAEMKATLAREIAAMQATLARERAAMQATLARERSAMRAEVDAILARERAAMRAEMNAILERERAAMQDTLARERAEMQETMDHIQRNAQDHVQRVLNENNALRAELGRVKDAVNVLAARYFDNVHFESTEHITAENLMWLLERANLSGRCAQSCKSVISAALC